jgi:integrase
MATEGSIYQRKDGRWAAQYTDAKGKTRYLYRKTKAEAKKALREALRDRDEGYVPADKLTVGMYLDEWMDERKNTISYRTWRSQESMIRNRVKPHIGSVRLCKLSGKDVRGMYRRLLSDGLTASTVGNVHVILKQALRDAVREKCIRTNPLDDVKPPKQERKEKDVLTPDEVRRLLDAVSGERFEVVYVLGATCGLRIGEILALRVEDIDLERGTIRIERTLYNGQCSAPKTTSSRRTLTLPQRALQALTRLCKVHGNPSGYLFATSSGKPVDVSNFYKWSFRPALRRAGLPETLTPHSLRHGTASLLLNQNVPVPVVSKYLGHANPGITMKVYAHMIDGTSGMASAAMNEAIGSS